MRHSVLIPAFFLAGALSAVASVDTGLLSLVPPDAKMIGAVDVTRARSSEFGQYLLGKAQSEDGHLREMVEQTGFDPRRDLQDLMFMAGGQDAANKPSSFAILARGNFDPDRIRTLAVAKGAMIVNYHGLDLIVHPQEKGQRTAIGFPEVGIAVMADFDTLKQIVSNRSTPTTLDASLQNTINSIGNSNDAWYVSLTGPGFLADHMGAEGGPQAKALQGVVQSSGGVKLGSLIETTLDAVTRSPQDAASLTDVVRFLASMVQMQRQNDPRAGILAAALDGMTLQNSGATVHFAVSLPEKSLEQLAEAAPNVRGLR
jgi:hypothetical protein